MFPLTVRVDVVLHIRNGPLPASREGASHLRRALDFLRKKRVLIVSGSGFNWNAPDHFRIVYLPRLEELKKATDRLRDFLRTYRQK